LINYVDRGDIVLKTLDVNETCGYDYKEINHFDKDTMKWKKKLENYEWGQNYFGCTVFVSPYFTDPDYSSLDFLSLPYEVARMVGQRINFTVAECDEKQRLLADKKIKVSTTSVPMGEFYELRLFYGSIDFSLDYCLSSYDFIKTTFMITPGEPYSNFEKLYLPFDNETWKYLIITYGLAFSLIFVINQLSREFQVFQE
jgi:hypothetical protein